MEDIKEVILPDTLGVKDVQAFEEKPKTLSVHSRESSITAKNQNEETKTFKEKLQFAFLMVGIVLAMFMMSVNTTVVAPAMSIIATDLDSIESQAWIAAAYLVGVNTFQPLAGKFSDIFGRKPVYLFAIASFFIGCLVNALAKTFTMLVAGRTVQGFGGGGVLALSYIIVTDIAPSHLRPRFQAMLSVIYGLASVVGPLIGGVFVDKASWHWDFWLNVIIGGITSIVILFFLKKPRDTTDSTLIEKLKRVDYLGSFFAIAFICCVLLGLNFGPVYGWKDAHSVGPFVCGGVALILLVITEGWIAKEPILPASVLLKPSVAIVYLFIMSVGFGFIGVLYFAPIYFQAIFGNDSTASGIHLIPYMACLIVGAIFSSILVTRFTNIKYYMVVGAACNVLGFGLFYTVNESSNWGQQACFFMFCGLAFGLTQQNCVLTVQSLVDPKDISVATSCNNFFLIFASSIGVGIYQALYGVFLKDQFTHLAPEVLVQAQKVGALSNYLYIRQLPLNIQVPVIHAYSLALHNVFIIPIVISAIGFILSIFFKNVHFNASNGKKTADEEITIE